MRPRPRILIALAIAVWFDCSACVNRLPDQDRRITVTPAVAKMTAEDLWKDFQQDEAAARTKYWGKAIEVSGRPSIAAGSGVGHQVFFAQTGSHGVQANLLDDEAKAIVAEVESGARIRLKCFCEGLDGNVVLKSCVRAE